MELLTKAVLQPGLDAEVLVPGDASEEGYTKPTSLKVCTSCGWNFICARRCCRDDGWDGGGEGQRKKNLRA